MAYLLPAIVHRVESYLIALEAFEMLHIQVPAERAREAMTKDSINTDEHAEEQLQFQRGMGKNYERLEFLGDCFLKMATSISLFGQNPNDNEYQFHVDRMVMICNQNLLQHAIDMKLFEYIRSKAFSR